MFQSVRMVEELAKQSEATVLILGATGTGKTTMAERIHREGIRSRAPFVTVNLASQHEATIESALFGHERGAFTGADRSRIGLLESARGGTVFFDEIGELSLPLQARLLEFLQTRRLTPLGTNASRAVDVRVICATNRDLENDVKQGRFREDLFHRIRVLTVELRSVAELPGEDLCAVIHETLARASERMGKKIYRLSKEVVELFECYPWPGNYRELESVIEVGVLAARAPTLELSDFPRWFISSAKASREYRLDVEVAIRPERPGSSNIGSAEVPLSKSFSATMRRFESAVLMYYLDRNRGNLSGAAREAGIPKATFHRKAAQHRLAVGSARMR